MRNFPAAERLSQAPIYKSGVSESPAVEVEALQPDVVSLSPDDVYAYSSSSPPRFEVMPELPGQDLSEDAVDLNIVSGIREKTSRGGKTVEELTTGSKEYVSVRRQLADFLYSERFRTQGRDAITDTLINSIELFHLQVRQGEVGRAKHEEELNELVNLLNRVPESGGQPEALMLQREGILELLDFVKEPFFCHQMWLLCQIAS